MSEGAPFFYGVKILGDIGIFDEYCRLIEYNNDNSQDYVQIHYENNGSPDTLGIETPAGLYPRTGGYLRGGTRETAPAGCNYPRRCDGRKRMGTETARLYLRGERLEGMPSVSPVSIRCGGRDTCPHSVLHFCVRSGRRECICPLFICHIVKCVDGSVCKKYVN